MTPAVVERKWNGSKIYAVDRIGAPLTPSMAHDLREGRSSPHLIARGLAQNPAPYVPPRAPDDPFPLTAEGTCIRALLGSIPEDYVKLVRFDGRVVDREYATAYCRDCHAFRDARLIAWGHTVRACITCATKETK